MKKVDENDQNNVMNSVKKIENKGKKAVRQRLLYCEVLEKQLMKR